MRPVKLYKHKAIEAIQYLGPENINDVLRFAIMHNIDMAKQPNGSFKVHCQTGTNTLRVKDWLVNNGPNDSYPVQDTVIRNTYAPPAAVLAKINQVLIKKRQAKR